MQTGMASVANPHENSKAESFFGPLRLEEVYLKDYRSVEEAEENIGRFIEEVYDQKRLHPAPNICLRQNSRLYTPFEEFASELAIVYEQGETAPAPSAMYAH